MLTSLTRRVFGSCLIVVGLAASACGATVPVTVHGFSFSPKDFTIAVGDTIQFKDGGGIHTATGNDAEPFCGAGFFTTCTTPPFLTAGDYRFHCIPHVAFGMTGVVHVVEAVTSPFMVVVHGQGTVTPDLNGQALLVGNSYNLTAMPAVGWVFSGWSGGVTSSVAQLNFVMQSNLVIEATFLRNPFLTGAGSYNGLFYVEDGVQHPTSGAFTFTLTPLGKYSGRLQSAGKTYPFTGQFDMAGLATNSVKRAKTNALVMELALDTEGDSDRVTGRVLDSVAGWTAELEGDRAPTFVPPNISPYQGTYTLIVTNEEAEAEFGDGFGTATIDAKGKLKLKATLADGTAVSQSVPVSKDGMWPLYVPLYSGKGSILSWVQVNTNAAPEASLYGELSWIKPALPTGKYYRAGFTNEMDLAGSIYIRPTTNNALTFGAGTFSVSGGNLATSFTNQVQLGPKNVLTNLTPAQPLVVKITPASGLFQGSLKVTDGGGIKTLKYKGALLQHQGRGAGFFLGVDESGSARLEPAP